MSALHAERLAGEEGRTAELLRSLRRAADYLGEEPNSSSYRRAWKELWAAGEEIEGIRAEIDHFGSWRQAREALDLSATS